MNYKHLLLTAATIGLAAACSATKKTQASATPVVSEPVINLDTLKVYAEEPPKKKIYQATNTRLSDIIHTKLEVSFDWQNSQLKGKATITARPYFYPTNMLMLDARGMDIKSVSAKTSIYKPVIAKPGQKVSAEASQTIIPLNTSYTYKNDTIFINLGQQFKATEQYTVQIEYVAKPNDLKEGGSDAITSDKGLYFINPKGEDPNKMPQIWTQGETQSNSAWFPTIDNPNEKMTEEIYINVDNKYTTLSNGVLAEQIKNADGTRTDHWKMDLPHAPYLVMMGVGEFVKVTDEPWNGKEISYYVEKEYAPHAKAIFGNTKEMVDFYSKTLGVPYAWNKYSQIVARDYVSGAMENTTATLHGDFLYQTTRETIDGIKGEDVIAHELFHQWFGDLASCESWSNLPLNESFATYGEYLWEEHKYGRDAADEHSAQSRAGYFAQASQKQVDLVRFDYESREDMFDAFSYNKGGQVLHMLRKAVGDDAFFASLKLYLETNKFKTAEVHNLRLAFEEVTGTDMNWFFNEWFYAKGHPELNVTKSYDAASKKLTLMVKQNQDFKTTPLYKLPIDIDIYAGGKMSRTRIWLQNAADTFKFDVATAPDLVNFDAEKQLLAKTTYNQSKDEYLFQYKNAPLWQDRSDALDELKSSISDAKVYETIKWAAQHDKYKNLRSKAIGMLSEVAKDKESELKPMLMEIATKDESTKVRAKAIGTLAKNYTGKDLDELYEKGMSEQSYAIVSESFDAIAKTNPTLAKQKAKQLENEPAKEIIYSVADFYAKNGDDSNSAYFKGIQKNFTGFELLGFYTIYGKFLKRCTTPEAALEGAKAVAMTGKTDNKYVNYTAQKLIKDNLVNVWQDREDKLNAKIEKAKKDGQDVTALNNELKTVSDTKKQLVEIYNSLKK